MKKIYIVIIFFVLIISLFSCNNEEIEYVYQSDIIDPVNEAGEYINENIPYVGLVTNSFFKTENNRIGFIVNNNSEPRIKIYNSEEKSFTNIDIDINKIFYPDSAASTNDISKCELYFTAPAPDECFVLLMSHPEITFPKSGASTNSLIKIDRNGNSIFIKSLSELSNSELPKNLKCPPIVKDLAVSPTGTIYAYMEEEFRTSDAYSNYIVAISEDGDILYTIDMPNDKSSIGYPCKFTRDKNNEVYFCYHTFNGYRHRKINEKKEKLDSTSKYPSTNDRLPILSKGYDSYYYNTVGLFGLNTNSISKCLFAWSDIGLYDDMIKNIEIISDKDIYIEYEDKNKTFFTRVTAVPANESDIKQLTIAYDSENDNYACIENLIKCAGDFNRANKDLRIKLFAYTSDDRLSATQKLTNDISMGKSPDIVICNFSMSYQLLNRHNLFRDLYEFIDNDTEYNRNSFLPCVLRPFENGNGKLNALTTDFAFKSLTCSKSIFDYHNKFTFSDLSSISESYDYLMSLRCEVGDEKSVLLESLLDGMLSNYIDYDSKSCNFMDEFASLLEFCNNAKINICAGLPDPQLYIDNKAAFRIKEFSSIPSIVVERQLYSPNDVISCVGYPSDNDIGDIICPWMQLAITTQSQHPDKAWEFIKLYINEQYNMISQINNSSDYMSIYFFPCTYHSIELLFDISKNYSIDVSGNYIIDPVTKETEYSTSYSISEYDGTLHENSYLITGEDTALLRYLFENITTAYIKDDASRAIISEEASYYFSGAKSLEETVKIIQNRINTRINE